MQNDSISLNSRAAWPLVNQILRTLRFHPAAVEIVHALISISDDRPNPLVFIASYAQIAERLTCVHPLDQPHIAKYAVRSRIKKLRESQARSVTLVSVSTGRRIDGVNIASRFSLVSLNELIQTIDAIAQTKPTFRTKPRKARFNSILQAVDACFAHQIPDVSPKRARNLDSRIEISAKQISGRFKVLFDCLKAQGLSHTECREFMVNLLPSELQ